MKLIFLTVAFSFFTGASGVAKIKGYDVVRRAEITIEKPAFTSLVQNGNYSSLIISSFKPFGVDHIFQIPNVEDVFKFGVTRIDTLTDKIPWPNEVQYLDSSLLGKAGLLICSGFLFPSKSTGAVTFLDLASDIPQKITQDKPGYFYHRAVFADPSHPEKSDIITARSKIPLFGAKDGQLVLLQRPPHPLTDKWGEIILANGPDIHFRVFKRENLIFVIAAEFSNKRLSLFWLSPDGKIGNRIVDDSLGAPFDLNFYDLNNDGNEDLLVTNHEKDDRASVFAYEMPRDLKIDPWPRHTLLTGIQTRQKGVNQASPGVAKAFDRESALSGREKPWILVSGDGSQRVHLLTPESQDSNDWHYSENIILDTKSTVGEPVIGDFDGDGLADFIIPAYDANLLYFLSLKKY